VLNEARIEVRQVTEAGRDCDVRNAIAARAQAAGRVSQARRQDVAVRRLSGDAPIDAQKVERAHVCSSREIGERTRLVGVRLDITSRTHHCALVAE
jgi:2-keto-4-pentenoate hydratase